MAENGSKILCQNLWKIFGPDPEGALPDANNGMTREEILEQTGHVIALKDVSFDVQENEIFVVMGLSGSGKSTLTRCMNHLIEPTKGIVLINGVDLDRMNDAELRELRRHKLSLVFQHFGLLPHRSVLDNVIFGLEVRGDSKTERREKAMEALDLVGLKGWERSRVHELSGGMQQRVGLARALAVGSEILFMDEPFSALDPLIRRQMQDEFLSLRSVVKKTVVFITHDLIEALKLGDRIAIMRDGEIVQLGTPEEIVETPADDYVSEFVKDVPRGKVVIAQSIMKEPEVRIGSDDSLDLAIDKMKKSKAAVAFVVDDHNRLEGIVSMEKAVDAVRNGLTKTGEALQKEFPFTSPDTPLEQFLDLVAEGNVPVAVLDEERHLLGIATRRALINALSTSNGGNGANG